MATFRSWGKQFCAYFDAGRFETLPCIQQQAFLNNCLDDVLRARVDREASATTPVFSQVPGLLTCFRVLDAVFLESNPIHLRRKQFFDARQRKGQTIIEFREELLSLIEEADGANIGVNDLICMMLQIGASDPALRRELGAIRNPTLNIFNEKIEGFEQARKTELSSAHGLAAKGSNPRRQGGQQGRNNTKTTPNKSGNSERSRRAALRGRCFRCSREDHLLPQCSYPASVKCNTCNGQGHISPACGKRQAANLSQAAQPTSSPSSPASIVPQMQQLAIGYDGAAHSPSTFSSPDGAASANWGSQSISSRAGTYYTPSNRPTPEMPL